MENQKSTLRKELIVKRLEISPEYAADAALKLAENLLPHIPQNAIVAGYSAMRGEIDVFPLLRELAARGNKICLPTISLPSPSGRGQAEGKILQFLAWQTDTALVPGKYGVLCPPDSFPALTPDILIVPMVAFDKSGFRLGYGGGYYDATIHELRGKNKNLCVIGVAYSFQEVDKLPVEAHDEKMDRIITG